MQCLNIAKLTWLELWQSRTYKILLLLGLLAPGFGIVMGSFFMVDIGKVYVDSIAASSQMIAIAYLVLLVITLMARDVFERICYLLLMPPVTRTDYFSGRFLGFSFAFLVLLFVLFLSASLSGLFYLGSKSAFYQSGFSWQLLAQLMFFHFFQYISILGMIFFIISWVSGSAEAMLFTLAALLFSWVFPPVLHALQSPEVVEETPVFVMQILQWVYDIVPHLQGAELSLSIAHGIKPNLVDTFLYVGEHILYAVVFFLLGLLIFKRRDL